MHIIIGFITSFISFSFVFIKARKLSVFIKELTAIDDELLDLCDKVHIDYRKSFIFQLKLSIASVLLFGVVGGFDYFVFQGWISNLFDYVIRDCVEIQVRRWQISSLTSNLDMSYKSDSRKTKSKARITVKLTFCSFKWISNSKQIQI